MEVETETDLTAVDRTDEKTVPLDIPEHELTPKSSTSTTENDESKENLNEGEKPDHHLKKEKQQIAGATEVSRDDKSLKVKDEKKMDIDDDPEDKTNENNVKTSNKFDSEGMKKETEDSSDDEKRSLQDRQKFTCDDEANDKENEIVSGGTTTTSIENVPIPETILSPPKSETQTDETNTASSSSSASASNSNSTSPASDTQMSPPESLPVENLETRQQNPVQTRKVRENEKRQCTKVITNGSIPKSGKPLMADINKKHPKSAASKSPRIRKPKSSLVTTMYESEISDKKGGIKLCIKKSDTSFESPKANSLSLTSSTTSVSKVHRKRSRKSKSRPQLDSDDSEYEPKKKQVEKQKKQISFSSSVVDKDSDSRPVVDQTDWGLKLPEDVLYNIFQMVCDRDGCLPTLIRLGRVCSLWRRVSLFPKLWKSLDLSTWIKEKYRTESKLRWFLENRCSHCTELNLANWKVTPVTSFLNTLAKGCPNLEGITLSGWKSFNNDHLTFLVDNLPKLQRLDLSSVNVDMNASKSAVGLLSICNALQTMNGRLTHLYLAHNRLAGIPQIVTVLASHCPNLVSLDLSNVTTQATSHGILHIEKLQHGCQKLKVLRVTNSHITLSSATMQEQMDSPGFPELEELSVAALTHESRIICDEHLQRILKTSSKLKLLDVRGCMRLTHESLIRLPAWDIKHLFLSGCSITRDVGSGLELIASKWAHSLIELDLAWANVQQSLDNALKALAEKGAESPLAHLNLCGSSVSDEAVKEILANCPQMSSINLASCRGLPRGVKRLMKGNELQELRDILKVQMKVKLPNESSTSKQNQDDDKTKAGENAANKDSSNDE